MKKENDKEKASSYAEGVLSILAVLNNQSRQVEHIYLSDENKLISDRRIRAVKKLAQDGNIPFELSGEEFIDQNTVGTTHGGLIARVGERKMKTVEELFSKENGFIFLLDGIEDPYNFSYAIRAFYAFGASGMIVSKRNWMSAAGVVIRGSAGTSERIDCARSENNNEIIKCAKDHGYKIVCADENTEVTLKDANLKKPVFVIIGGEKRGISSDFLAAADITLKIPYRGDFNFSLTATAASSIIAYEVSCQN